MKKFALVTYSIIGLALLLSAIIFGAYQSITSTDIRAIRLEEAYAFLAIICLFLAVAAGPLYRLWPKLATRDFHIMTLGGFGISAFYFALLHASVNFFVLLRGFEGIGFLGLLHERAVSLGFIGLIILAAMAGSSINLLRLKLGDHWKRLQRFVYLAVAAIVLHVLMIGTHFRGLDNAFAAIAFVLFALLLGLYAATTKNYLGQRYPQIALWKFTALVSLAYLSSFYLLYILHLRVIGGHAH